MTVMWEMTARSMVDLDSLLLAFNLTVCRVTGLLIALCIWAALNPLKGAK